MLKQHGNIAVDSRSSAQNRFPRLKRGPSPFSVPRAPAAEDRNTGRSAASASVACLTSDRVVHRSQPHERYRCHDVPRTPTDASRGRITRCGCDSRNLHHPARNCGIASICICGTVVTAHLFCRVWSHCTCDDSKTQSSSAATCELGGSCMTSTSLETARKVGA